MSAPASQTPDDIQRIADHLLGSCATVEEALGTLEIADVDPAQVEDEVTGRGIFRCACCSWWVEDSDESESERDDGERICSDCGREE